MLNSFATPARSYAKGIGDAVADRTINRKVEKLWDYMEPIPFEVVRRDDISLDAEVSAYAKSLGYVISNYTVDHGDGEVVRGVMHAYGRTSTETWEDVARRVALGNSLLEPNEANRDQEFHRMHHHMRQASLLMSGRHLQHGDESQPTRNQEVFTNCSTAASTFLTFYLLLNGSGVGRAYDDEMMLVDYSKMPIVVPVIDYAHKDVQSGEIVCIDKRIANHLYLQCRQHYFKVPDSREGWTKALELIERLTFEGTNRDLVLILDFSDVRPRGAPIMGMQGRPASGPGALMSAIKNIAALRDAGMAPWRSAMYADHYVAECVLVGGARRAARMATKYWKDETVLDFIQVKRGGFLWSSNNSVTVDEEFWRLVKAYYSGDPRTYPAQQHAVAVFNAICEAAYHDGTGEPGIINVDKLTWNNEGIETLLDGDFAESEKYKLDPETKSLHKSLATAFANGQTQAITNPCVTADTWVQTSEGPRQVGELVNKPFAAVVNGKAHTATGFWKTGDKPVFKVKTDRGYEIRATDNHKLLVETSRKRKSKTGFNVETEWVEVKDLEPGDKLVLSDQSNLGWGESGGFDEGWLLGEVVGDGGHNPDAYPTYVRFWGDSRDEMSNRAANLLGVTVQKNALNETSQIACKALGQIATGMVAPGTKTILPALEKRGSDFVRGFLRGIFDADGSVQGSLEKGVSIRLWGCNERNMYAVQRMLARLGIASTIYWEREPFDERNLPDGKGGLKSYLCSAGHELVISKDNIVRFADRVGFYEPAKAEKLQTLIGNRKREIYKERFTAEVVSIEADGVEAVYDCTVDEVHCFDANGIIAHNCGEIVLGKLGGYCVIADVVPYHAGATGLSGELRNLTDWDNDAEDAFRTATRALIRTNLMDSLYKKEVARTNRIGVGITGFHEWAFARFGFGWKDIVSEEKSKSMWLTLSRFKRAVQEEASEYAKELGVAVPHTNTTVKPAGTTSKLFGLTEGAHLPSMREFLRWVQFRFDDPLVEEYRAKGYPIRELRTYSGTTIVGFPTAPTITTLGMGDLLVTAGEATPEEQYEYLRLLEKYWIVGVEEDGVTPLEDRGNQVSYTLKYLPSEVSFEEFKRTLLEGQSTIRCCSVMPQADTTAYEYQPEQPVTKHEYELIRSSILDGETKEDVGLEHVDCASGACPVSFDENK